MSIPEGYIQNNQGDYVKSNRLRVYRVLATEQDALISDFTILGFKKLSPRYDRGRKVKAEYRCPTANEMIVEKIFTDVRDSNGTIEALEITFNWFDESNNIGLTKTETVKRYNKYQAETEERQRRERQLDFLIASARSTPFESFIGALFLHYKAEIQNYKEEWDSQGWDDAMSNETSASILTILNTPFPTATNPYKANFVKDAIRYQIGTIDSTELTNREIDTPQSILGLLGL
jgi:hypothetical protein